MPPGPSVRSPRCPRPVSWSTRPPCRPTAVASVATSTGWSPLSTRAAPTWRWSASGPTPSGTARSPRPRGSSPGRPRSRTARPGWPGSRPGCRWSRRGSAPRCVHSPHYTMPLRSGRPVVVTLHDATFFTDPQMHTPVKGTFFRSATRTALRRAARCVVPSRGHPRRAGPDPRRRRRRASTSPTTASTPRTFAVPSEAEKARVRARLGLTASPYVAFLSTLEPRKNVPGLVRGWVRACADRPDPPALVLAGGAGWDDEVDGAVAEVPAHLRVLRPGYLRFADLPGFLGGALLVAYPSLGEGFGLPVLEAMACGAPVLTTRRLSLPEVGGDAVAYTEPDPDSIAAALGVAARRPRPAGPARRRPAASGRSSSPGTPAPRRTWRATPRRSARDGGPAPGRRRDPGRRRHLLARRLADGVPRHRCRPPPPRPYEVVLADNGSTDGASGGRRRRGPSGCCRPAGTSATAGRRTSARPAARRPWLVVANPDVRWEPGSLDALLAAAGALAAGRLPRTGDPHAGRRALPLGAGVPVARTRHRARPARLVLAGQPVDAVLPRGGRPPGGGRRPAGCPGRCLLLRARGLRLGRRLRPGVLHVLRGHRPVPPAGRGRLAERVRPVRRRHAHRRARHPPGAAARCCWSTTARCTGTCPGSTPGRRTHRSGSRCGSACGCGALLALRVRALGEGAAPTRSADLLEDSA